MSDEEFGGPPPPHDDVDRATATPPLTEEGDPEGIELDLSPSAFPEAPSYFNPAPPRMSTSPPKSVPKFSINGSAGVAVDGGLGAHMPHKNTAQIHQNRLLTRDLSKNKRRARYFIPMYDQAVFKFIFRSPFDEGIDSGELMALVSLVAGALVQVTVVTLNIATLQTQASRVFTYMNYCVFGCETAVVWFFFLFAIASIIEGCCKKTLSTDVAVDVSEVLKKAAGFSSLKVVRLVSVQFVTQRIVPFFSKARRFADFARAVVATIGWLILSFVACIAVVLKVSQVSFVATLPFEDWGTAEFLKMFGLVLNLAKVDNSYEAETETLLAAVHKHFSGPGGPDSINARKEPVYSRVLAFFNIPRPQSYEYFEAVFNHHFGVDQLHADMGASMSGRAPEAATNGSGLGQSYAAPSPGHPESLPDSIPVPVEGHTDAFTGDGVAADNGPQQKNALPGQVVDEAEFCGHGPVVDNGAQHKGGWRHHVAPPPEPLLKQLQKSLNFMAFILQLDNHLLRQYLHMVESPLPYYTQGKDRFEKAQADLYEMWELNDRQPVSVQDARNFLEDIEAAIVCADPTSEETIKMSHKYPRLFTLTYGCKEPEYEVASNPSSDAED